MKKTKYISQTVSLSVKRFSYNMMSQKFQTEQQELDERIEKLETELATEKETVDNAKKWIALIKQFSIPTELTAELLNTLVEKIVVHEATKNDMCLNYGKRERPYPMF